MSHLISETHEHVQTLNWPLSRLIKTDPQAFFFPPLDSHALGLQLKSSCHVSGGLNLSPTLGNKIKDLEGAPALPH